MRKIIENPIEKEIIMELILLEIHTGKVLKKLALYGGSEDTPMELRNRINAVAVSLLKPWAKMADFAKESEKSTKEVSDEVG